MEQNTEQLIRDLGTNLSGVIDQISTKLGTTAGHLWEVLCRQAVIQGIFNLIYFIAWSLIVFFFIRFLCKNWNAAWTTGKNGDCSDSFGFSIVGCVGSIIIWIICMFRLPNAISGIFNPEYVALREIMEALKLN